MAVRHERMVTMMTTDRIVRKAEAHVFVVIWTAFAAFAAFVYGCCLAVPVIF